MSPATFDHAPGDIPQAEEGGSSGLLVYTTGLLLAVALTATSFWVANTQVLWGPGIPLGLAVLAIAQMGVHLVFFLHITSGPDNTNNALALAFGVLVVMLIVTGSLVIMDDLKMTPDTRMDMPVRASPQEMLQ
jgi:cytochrome o ubiquinol oxidase operon protein cyoD